MAELHPNDIGLATYADVGDVNNLNTTARVIVEAINELLASGGEANFGEQLLNEGENNIAIGSGNIIHGNGNVIFGSGNIVCGDNHLLIGSNKALATYPELGMDWYDTSLNRMYYYYYGNGTMEPIPVGTKVAVSLYQSWTNDNWTDYVYYESPKIVTEVTECNLENGYIAVAALPEIPVEPPDATHTIMDYGYVSTFYILSDEFKINGNGSVNLGGRATGMSSITGNSANASGTYATAFNLSNSKNYCSFSVNSATADGYRAFAANQGQAMNECAAALNYGCAYTSYSAAINYARAAGRAIRCTAMNSSVNSVTAAAGEVVSNLTGAKILMRYKNAYNTIIYNVKTVASVSGQVITFSESFGGSGYSLMPDGYIFRVESSYGYNFASGYGCTGNRYSQAHGLYTLGVHEGAVINGRYGVSPENYSWSLANGTAFTNMGLAIKMLQNGDIATDGTVSSPCADYAEYFEWQDGNPNGEDRAGYFVKLQGGKIVKCSEFDTPLGIVSAMPAIIGDSGEMRWKGKYITDDFGRIQYHDVVIPAELDEEGNVTVEEHTEHQPVLNPDWNSSMEYVPRQNRPEWSTVGVLGKLIVYDDGTLQSGDLCRCGANGTAAKSIESGYQVLNRVSDDKVLIWFRG